MLLCCLTAVLGDWSLDRYGPMRIGILLATFTGLSFLLTSQANATWQLFMTYSILFSLGTGALYVVLNALTTRWFVKKGDFAVGITSADGGVGTVFIAPFATGLISNYNWRTTFILLGILSWAGIASLSLLLKKDPRDIGMDDS